MEGPISNLKSEEGSIIIIALMLMTLMTLIGISATNTSNTELIISTNEHVYKRNFYRAEAVSIEGAQQIQTATPANLVGRVPAWLTSEDDPLWATNYSLPCDEALADFDNWTTAPQVPQAITTIPGVPPNSMYYAVVDYGIAAGSSMSMTATTQVRSYSIYGLYIGNDGRNLIEVGYKRRF